MNVAGIALEGIQQASVLAESAARRISQSAGAGRSGDIVDLSAEMVALAQARNLSGAMVSVAHAAEEMDSRILNLLG